MSNDHTPHEPTRDPASYRMLRLGWCLLAIFLPLGLTLEALHALKLPVYLGSAMRRELWTLAHAHGNFLGILCLLFAALAPTWIPSTEARSKAARFLGIGAVLLPLGFFLGGILNYEGDPSLGILLVPLGALSLLAALLTCLFQSKA